MAPMAPAHREAGFGMITVVLAGMVTLSLLAVMVARVWSDTGQVGQARGREQAIHVAEAAIDDLLFEVNQDASYSTAANDNSETMPLTFSSVSEEETWARAEAATSTNLGTVADGEWVAVKPPGRAIGYGVGYVPARTGARHVRVVRIEYDFASTTFDTAILTDGDFTISGSPTVSGAQGSLHANGDLTTGGSPSFSGYAAAAGTASANITNYTADDANSGGGRPARAVPTVNPRDHFPLAEYLLCKDGSVRAGPAYLGAGTTADPAAPTCSTGTILHANATSNPYLGWKKTGDDASAGAKWDYSSDTPYTGVFYIQEGSATVSGNAGTLAAPWTATIIAEATAAAGHAPNHCSTHKGGDIVIGGNPTITRSPRAHPLSLVAGRDLSLSGNPGTPSAEALFAAHEQLKISGDPDIYGAIVVNDSCDSASSAVADSDTEISGNPQITFNGTFGNPFANTVRITRWQEL
jgi:hypothetical protein